MPIGQVTRGTTGTNRLRRMDRWIAQLPQLRRPDALVVDLGYGASATTVLELQSRLGVPVVGLEISPERVADAVPFAREGVRFALGGFELAGLTPTIVRAANVLRQYREDEVLPAWREMVVAPATRRARDRRHLQRGRAPRGVGRGRRRWPCDPDGGEPAPQRRGAFELAERLPKILIHRNVAGERIHQFFADLDRAWDVHAGLGVYSPRSGGSRRCECMKDAGWPITGGVRRWRLGELTVTWDAVAPAGFRW